MHSVKFIVPLLLFNFLTCLLFSSVLFVFLVNRAQRLGRHFMHLRTKLSFSDTFVIEKFALRVLSIF